jgi:small subunit ribosomal protein S24e
MDVEIISRKENKILNRQEVGFLVKGAGATPSRKELREKIAALLNADEKTIIVDVLKTSYGSTELKGIARIYKNKKDLERLELSYVIARNFPEEKKTTATTAPNK